MHIHRNKYTHKIRTRRLFNSELRGAVATNALELGVDIGHLDATLHLGFPGSLASLWQQAGRSGRSLRPSLSVLVAHDSPLDQYVMRHPAYVFEGRAESAVVDPTAPQLLAAHLMCAAFELPLCWADDSALFGGDAVFGAAFKPIKQQGWIKRAQQDGKKRGSRAKDGGPLWRQFEWELQPKRSWKKQLWALSGLITGGGLRPDAHSDAVSAGVGGRGSDPHRVQAAFRANGMEIDEQGRSVLGPSDSPRRGPRDGTR